MNKVLVLLVLLFTACSMYAQQDLDRAKWQIQIGRYTEGARLLRPLADNGNAEAQYIAAKLFFSGQGVMQSDAQGVKYATMATKSGRVDALVLLINHYIATAPSQGQQLLETYLTTFPDSVAALGKEADDAVIAICKGYFKHEVEGSQDAFEAFEKIYGKVPALGELIIDTALDEQDINDIYLKILECNSKRNVTAACQATYAKLQFSGKCVLQHHRLALNRAKSAAAQNSAMGKYLAQKYEKKRMPGYTFKDAVIFNTNKRLNEDQAYSRAPAMLTWKETLAEMRKSRNWRLPTKEEAKIMMKYYSIDKGMKDGDRVTIWTVNTPWTEGYYWQTYDNKGNVVKEEPDHNFLGSYYDGKVLMLPIIEVKHKE